ncbi:hypothetical protein JCM15519_17250 [Fundidesulfovibrio butyratiphilus]
MNAAPAQHLTVVGGKAGPGRPSKEEAAQRQAEAAAKRAETRAYLERVGLFEAANNKRSKPFDRWSVKECDAALKWAQKQIEKNGVEAPPVEKVAPAVATPPMPEEPARAESVRACGRVVDAFLDDPLSWPTPYVHEVVAWTRVFELEARVRELEAELEGAFGEIHRLTTDHEYKASLADILIVAGIDRGRLVRDLRRKLQQVITDAVDRDDPSYKAKVKALLTITFDKACGLPSEALAAIITCEVNEDTPPAVCGSRIYFDAKANIIPPKEYAKHMPLMTAGGAE